jgi:glycosyltransferase involved in cell wall biosynthesis
LEFFEPKFTIVTVVFNADSLLESTIHSVIANSKNNVDYIIVDGGSSDGTLDVIKQYEAHLKSWVSEKDNGIYDAMNKGWSMADPNSTILFLGAGDKLLSLPSKPLLDRIVYGRVALGDEGKVFYSSANWKLLFGNALHHQALFIPKQFSLHPPFDTKYKVYADFDFNQRLYKEGRPFEYSKDFMGYALPGGVSEKFYMHEMADIIYKNYGFWCRNIAYLRWSMSLTYRYFKSFFN